MLRQTSSLTTTNTVRGGPGITSTLCTSGLGMAPFTVVHVSPPSVLRRTPSTSSPTQTLCESVGSTAIPVGRGIPTFSHSAAIGTGRRCQLLPAAVERQLAGVLGVPTPANITFGSDGSVARLQIIEPLIGPSSRRQVAPASSLRYRPRSVPPYTTRGPHESVLTARTM